MTINMKNWMWLSNDRQEQKKEIVFACFRRELVLEKVPASYVVKISADSRYKLYINGSFAEAGPSKGNDKVWYYDEINLNKFLREGKNVIAVMVLHYPTEHWKGNCSVFRTETPGLYWEEAETKIYDNPNSEAAERDEQNWKCKTLEQKYIISENPYFAPLQIYEEEYGTMDMQGWMDHGFSDGDWKNVRYYQEKDVAVTLQPENMHKRTIPFMRRKRGTFEENIANQLVEVASNSKVSVVLSAGEIKTAYLKVQMIGGKDTTISILQSECYSGDIKIKTGDPYGSLPVKGNRTDSSLNLYGYKDVYHVAGCGTKEKNEIYEPFWFRTFRFVKITIETKDDPIRFFFPAFEEVSYPLDVISHVETSNKIMSAIWEICERSLRLCMHETYEDCPFYEQLQYAMDSRSQILYTYAISADSRLALKCMDDFRHSVRADGMINCSYPNYEKNVIPGFSVFYIGMVYDYMMYFGKKIEIKKHLNTIDGVLQYFHSHLEERGIVGKIGDVNSPENDWSFIDWTPEWDETNGVPDCTKQGPITMESLYYLLGLQYAAQIADYMEETEKAAEYRRCEQSLASAITTYCVGNNGMYQDGPGIETYSQHCQVFAVMTGLVSPQNGKQLLIETLTKKEKYVQCSAASMFYLFRALEICDIYEYTETLWDIWRDMLKNNLSTCAEDTLMSRSDCHAWGALALYELPASVLGVRPVKPGCAKIEVKPQNGYLKWAKGEVILPKGRLKVSWEKNDAEEMKLQIDTSELDECEVEVWK